jgi:hypothetical protein
VRDSHHLRASSGSWFGEHWSIIGNWQAALLQALGLLSAAD